MLTKMLYIIVKMIIGIIFGAFSLLTLTMFIPYKGSLSSLPDNTAQEYYVIWNSYEDGRFYVLGDRYGMFDSTQYKKHIASATWSDAMGGAARFGFEDQVSIDVRGFTLFIVYGTAEVNGKWARNIWGDPTGYTYYTIESTGWDVLGKIQSVNKVRMVFPKQHLTIWDLRWFDIFRERWFGYMDMFEQAMYNPDRRGTWFVHPPDPKFP